MSASFARVCALALFFSALALAASPAARAQRAWWWSKGGGSKRSWAISVEGGVRLMTHYNQETVLSTPPKSVLAEMQAAFWYKQQGGIYLLFSRTLVGDTTQLYGGGIKFPFLSLQGSRTGVVGGISMMLMADLVSYSFPPPVAPADYPATGLLFRYGPGIQWGVGNTGFLVDTTMMFTTANGNFFVAPLIGVGFHF